MFITSKHREYWNNLVAQHPEERDENGVELYTIRASLARTPQERVDRMRRYSQILTQIFPRERVFSGRCIITNRLAAAVEDYVAANQTCDAVRLELTRWAIYMMLPESPINDLPLQQRWREPR